MISRPMTDQLIADVCQDLVDAVLPALTDETLQVRVAMAETVLRNAAARAAHEIAWMTDETATLIEYANTVNARIPNVELTAALAAFDEAPQPACISRTSSRRMSERARRSPQHLPGRSAKGRRSSSTPRGSCCMTESAPRRR